jgi:hypothetical protein
MTIGTAVHEYLLALTGRDTGVIVITPVVSGDQVVVIVTTTLRPSPEADAGTSAAGSCS